MKQAFPVSRILVALATLGSTNLVVAQQVPYEAVDIASPGLDSSMRHLASVALDVPDPSSAANRASNRAALQFGAAQYAEALVALDQQDASALSTGRLALMIYVDAKGRQAKGESFATAYTEAYANRATPLTNRAAYDLSFFLGRHPNVNRRIFERALRNSASNGVISLAQAVDLVRGYAWWKASEEFWSVLPAATAADDEKRYVVDQDVRVRTPDGATVTGILVRPKTATKQVTLLTFGIYPIPAALDDARRSAAMGYAGLWGFSRGKYHSAGPVVPWEHDGADARALIDWIARQSWSDGRVAMSGGSYQAFAEWAAAKRMPAALKAIFSSAPTAPGITGPMENNVFFAYQYRFVPYVASGPMLDEEGYNDFNHWNALNKAWYTSGRPYFEMDQVDGVPNPLYRRLLEHPAYDDYWQRLTPQGKEFLAIQIPVLITTGYYDGAAGGARHYFEELLRYNPKSDVAVVIGPYGHAGAQRQPDLIFGGYPIDAVASLDIEAMRYEWFDHVLKGGPRPALLKGRVNFEVMGANAWRHVTSYQEMSSSSLRLYLAAGPLGEEGKLQRAPSEAVRTLEVDLADRTDADRRPLNSLVLPAIDTHNSVVFESEPMQSDTEVSGIVETLLDFEINKRDADFVFRLYEKSPSGYLELASPYVQRASFVRDRTHRNLLKTGERTQLKFERPGPVSRLVKAGNSLVLILGIQKGPDAQINYGTGKDVSLESVHDAGDPLRIRLSGRSYVTFPLGPERLGRSQ